MRRANGIPGLSPIVAMTQIFRDVPKSIVGRICTKRTMRFVVVNITVRERLHQLHVNVKIIHMPLVRKTITTTAAL